MKIWELEEGKIYISGSIKYKIKDRTLLRYYNDSDCYWLDTSNTYNQVIFMEFEEIKREIDWSKVPQGTKVQVRDYKDKEWFNRYFYCFNSDCKYIYTVSEIKEDDEYTGATMSNFTNSWKYCRIHESVEIPDSWYKEEYQVQSLNFSFYQQ